MKRSRALVLMVEEPRLFLCVHLAMFQVVYYTVAREAIL
jgi:hypothetical protein